MGFCTCWVMMWQTNKETIFSVYFYEKFINALSLSDLQKKNFFVYYSAYTVTTMQHSGV